MIVHCLENKKI